MNLQQAYTTAKPLFSKITEEEYIRPNAQTAHILSDGKEQLIIANQDKKRLVQEGMSATLIDEVEKALGAYIWVSSLYDTVVSDVEEHKDEWQDKKREAHALRATLLKYGKFGAKKNSLDALLEEFNEVSENSSDDDMIYDLLRLNQIYTTHGEVVAGLPTFNSQWVKSALTLYTELSTLHATMRSPNAEERNKYYVELKQSYTHYHKKVYELREWGGFSFSDSSRVDSYKAQYMVKRKQK